MVEDRGGVILDLDPNAEQTPRPHLEEDGVPLRGARPERDPLGGKFVRGAPELGGVGPVREGSDPPGPRAHLQGGGSPRPFDESGMERVSCLVPGLDLGLVKGRAVLQSNIEVHGLSRRPDDLRTGAARPPEAAAVTAIVGPGVLEFHALLEGLESVGPVTDLGDPEAPRVVGEGGPLSSTLGRELHGLFGELVGERPGTRPLPADSQIRADRPRRVGAAGYHPDAADRSASPVDHQPGDHPCLLRALRHAGHDVKARQRSASRLLSRCLKRSR